jgi:double-strand break repair protein AddB
VTAPRLFHAPGPRVFAVPPGADFAAELARGLRARLGDAPPEAIARVALTLNTRRGGRAVQAAFEAQAAATFLPRMGALDDLADDPASEAPHAIDRGRRMLTLTRLVSGFLDRRPEFGPPAAAPALAAALGALLDEAQREGVDLAALDAAAPPEHAAHWETTLRFLTIVREHWPVILAQSEGGALDPEARRWRVVSELVARWRVAPPDGPLIAAGSTGSRAVTAMYLAAVARLPQGAVVLPGFDPALAAEVWEDIGDEHPWRGHRALIDGLGLRPADVPWWSDGADAALPRRRLIAQALRPAPVTDRWRAALPGLRAEIAEAAVGLSLIEAPDPRREALAVALALREAIETPGARAALVTPDRDLARRVAANLRRWGVEPDDSGGRPLSLTPSGVFLRLVADLGCLDFDAVALLALLKHPLCAAGPDRGPHIAAARRFELRILRRRPDLRDLREARAALVEDDAARDPNAPAMAPLLPALDALIAFGDCAGELAARAAAHLAAAEALAGPALWDKAAGEAAREAATRFAAAAAVFGPCPGGDYPAIFSAAMTGEARDEAYRPDPRVLIWGPLEARMQTADLVILGGLNEGVWPAAPAADPWLSRPMRKAVGLPSPERRIGLAAHDVMTGACAARAVLSRSLRSGGAPTSRSRWLERLVTLVRGVSEPALEAIRARGDRWLGMVDPLDRPAEDAPRARRPAPRPQLALRPDRLSATQVETLIRDPFAIYARHVLRLKALDPVGRDLDARDRGVALHAALARFARDAAEGAPLDAALAQAVDAALADSPATEAQRRLWRARLHRAAAALIRGEARRQAQGRPLTEITGARTADGFTLTARADRLDLRQDGTLALYDYKTGAPPSDKEIRVFAKQMPLEAAIAAAGGFEGVAPARIAELAHIPLSGKAPGEPVPLKDDPETLAAEAWEGLLRLIAAYRDPATGYPARARPKHIRYASDYDHLARYREWEDGDAAEDAPRDALQDAP